MIIILDTNVLLVSVGKASRFRPIWDAFVMGKFQLGLTQEILNEYEEVFQELSAPGTFGMVANIFTESPDIVFKHIYYRWNIITADPDDNKFFDAAVACNADYLVTNDNHFNIVKDIEFPKIQLCSAESFLELLKR